MAQGLEEITVTARKTTESLIAVPIAVTALSAEALGDRGIIDPLADVATFTPGFTFQNQTTNRNDRGFRTFTIRGMVPGSNSSIRQAVTIFVDGTPIMGGNVEGISSVERVEVVKGPQSAYFGRATFAGAVNYVTRVPDGKWGGKADVNVGTWGLTDISGAVEGPIVTDKVAFRVSGRAYHTSGQYTNIEVPQDVKLGSRDTKSVSGTLAMTPSDNFRAQVFISTWKDEDGPPANAQYNNNYYNCNAGAASAGTLNYICGQLGPVPQETRVYNTILSPAVYNVLSGAGAPAGYYILPPTFLNHFGLKRHATQVHGSAEYTLPSGYFISASGSYDRNKWGFMTDTTFRDTRNVPNASFGTVPNVLPYFSRVAAGGVYDKDGSAEIRLTSPRQDRFKWLVGGNWFHASSDQNTLAFGPTGFIAATPILVNIVNTLGAFASASYNITDQLTLSAEGRFQSDELFQETAAGANLRGNPANVKAEATFRSFTPRVILSYEPRKDLTLYTSYSEGTRPGEFNNVYFTLAPDLKAQVDAVTPVAAAVPEERIRMVEVGAKGLFLEDRLRILAAAYYGAWTNRHIPTVINTIRNGVPFQGLTIVTPGGRTRVTGFELEGAFQVTPELTLEGTFDLAASKIQQSFCADCRLTTGNANPVGNQLPFYPKTKATLAATYERPISSDVMGFIRVDYIYMGRIYDSEANLAWARANSKVNIRLGTEWGNYRAEVYGTNIFDDRTPSNLARNTDAFTTGNAISVSLANKASYGVRLSAKF